MKIQVKETVWRDIHIKDNIPLQEVVQFIENKGIADIYNSEFVDSHNLITEVCTEMEDVYFSQDGHETIVILDDEGEPIYSNTALFTNRDT